MKPFFNTPMKAWNQQAAAGDLAPEARQIIAHRETVGKNAGLIQAPDGAKEEFPSSPESAAPAGALGVLTNEPTAAAVGYFLPRLRR